MLVFGDDVCDVVVVSSTCLSLWCLQGFGPGVGHSDPIVRLMTSNLLHDSVDVAAFADTLERWDPDVVVTQELGIDCAEALAARYENHYLHPADDFRGRGIATRLQATFADIPMVERWGTTAQIHVDGRVWDLAGVHLVNPIDFPWWRSVPNRGRQLDALERWADTVTSGRVVVAGDFNATKAWPAYRRVAQRFGDLIEDNAIRESRRPEPTWGWRPGWPRMLRIDHIFGDGVAATDVEVVALSGSDHWAVVADLVATQ